MGTTIHLGGAGGTGPGDPGKPGLAAHFDVSTGVMRVFDAEGHEVSLSEITTED